MDTKIVYLDSNVIFSLIQSERNELASFFLKGKKIKAITSLNALNEISAISVNNQEILFERDSFDNILTKYDIELVMGIDIDIFEEYNKRFSHIHQSDLLHIIYAITHKADFLLTYDKDLQRFDNLFDIRILSPDDFLKQEGDWNS